MIQSLGVMDPHHLARILKPSAKRLGERCGIDAIQMLSRRLIEYLGDAEADRNSYIWRSAIEEHEQDAHREDSRSVIIDLLRDASLGAISSRQGSAEDIARLLLSSTHATIVRIGIHVCGEHYALVGQAFWSCAQASWFSEPCYWHEIYWLIRKAFPRFSASERNRFLSILDQQEDAWTADLREPAWRNAHIRDLLHPAFGLGDSDIDHRYNNLVSLVGPVREHPDFHFYITSGFSGDKSPISPDALAAMDSSELNAYLNGLTPEAGSLGGITFRGTASAIASAVRASADGFSLRMKAFASLDPAYQHGLLRGLKERWSDDKREIDWASALSLMHEICNSERFTNEIGSEPPDGWEPSAHWVVTDIADLLKAGLVSERHLPVELHVACLEVLRAILSSIRPEEDHSSDSVSRAINSPRGRALETFIYLALAMRRSEMASGGTDNRSWEATGPIFDSELEKSERGLNSDFATFAGMYCVNLHYLNPRWTEDNFDRLFSTKNRAAWACAAQGFAFQRHLYPWLFRRVVSGGHLKGMIYSDELPDSVCEKALQLLGLAYLVGLEELRAGGLLLELIDDLRTEQLERLCWFFWSLRGDGEESSREAKVITFWSHVAERIRADRVSDPRLLAALAQLAVYVRELTPQTVDLLKQAAPHAQVRHNGYMLMENLARLASQYPRQVAEIFREAISGFLPDYRREDIIECVTRLAEAGEWQEAERLCVSYAERGSTLLKETYEKLRSTQRSILGD